MNVDKLHNTLERLSNLLRTEARQAGASAGLQPVQIEVLHYLGQCNRYSDTLQAVTEFLGQTKGTVSKTVGVLQQRGLVERLPDADDHRVFHLRLTERGRELLHRVVPPVFLRELAASRSAQELAQLGEMVHRLLLDAQRARAAPSFGVCASCAHHLLPGDSRRCGLTGDALSAADAERICRVHVYPATAGAPAR
jgi:DNA-binding MarR family transcriptional regulator